MTNSTVLAVSFADRWHGFWSDPIGEWILARGVPIALYLIGGLLAARFITWLANRIVRRIDAEYREATSCTISWAKNGFPAARPAISALTAATEGSGPRSSSSRAEDSESLNGASAIVCAP